MPLANYSTTVPAERSIAEIHKDLGDRQQGLKALVAGRSDD